MMAACPIPVWSALRRSFMQNTLQGGRNRNISKSHAGNSQLFSFNGGRMAIRGEGCLAKTATLWHDPDRGDYGFGTVFRMAPNGSLSGSIRWLQRLRSALIQANDNPLGTTQGGGRGRCTIRLDFSSPGTG
jgi:hypothetical protein